MSKNTHHHGDLREALILAGLALMEEGGPEALTLRKCAARAGVSHAAPAYHFNGLVSLKAAIVARGYRIFTQTMKDHRAQAGPDPRAQLVAICKGYLAFSASHAALFRFMFQDFGDLLPRINASVLKELELESTRAYQVLSEACAPFEPPSGQAHSTEVLVWSLVHGYAMLFGGDKNASTPAGVVPDFARILPDFPLASNNSAKR